jgi:hypothetical protein
VHVLQVYYPIDDKVFKLYQRSIWQCAVNNTQQDMVNQLAQSEYDAPSSSTTPTHNPSSSGNPLDAEQFADA